MLVPWNREPPLTISGTPVSGRPANFNYSDWSGLTARAGTFVIAALLALLHLRDALALLDLVTTVLVLPALFAAPPAMSIIIIIVAACTQSRLVADLFGTQARLVLVDALTNAGAPGVRALGGQVHPGYRVVDHTTLREPDSKEPQQCRKRNEGEAPAKARVAVIEVHRGPPSPRARPREGLWR